MVSDNYNNSLSLWVVKNNIAAIAAVPETPKYVRHRAQVLIPFWNYQEAVETSVSVDG